MALSLELGGILWWNITYTLIYWQDVSHEIVKMTFEIGWVFAEVQFWKQWNLTLKPFRIFWQNFADTLILTRSSSRNCKMTFIIGRGCAKRQILKMWKWPYLLNWVKYFDKLLRKHWHWQDLAQKIAKWHFSLVEAFPSSKFWKSDTVAISWIEWNIVMKFCIHIDIDKMYPMRLSNDIWDWLSFCRGSILKKVRLLQNDIYHRSRLCRAPNSEKVKMALSLELSGMYW